MKFKTTIVLCCLSTLLVLAMGHESPAQQVSVEPWSRIGVVNVMKVLQLSQKNTDHHKKVNAERNARQAELQKMVQGLQADDASLKTMRPGSEDHLTQYKSMLLKQGELEYLEKFYTQTFEAEKNKWSQKIYQAILQATGHVAQEMGLKMVFERTEPEFPMPPELLGQTVSTLKLLYFSGPIDITDQVIDRVDASQI